MFIYLHAHTIACLFLPDFTTWNTSTKPHLYAPVKSFSAAKENLLFEVITMFSGGGSLWLRVASVGDTQRVIYARNFAVDNVTVGFGFAFYVEAIPLCLPI